MVFWRFASKVVEILWNVHSLLTSFKVSIDVFFSFAYLLSELCISLSASYPRMWSYSTYLASNLFPWSAWKTGGGGTIWITLMARSYPRYADCINFDVRIKRVLQHSLSSVMPMLAVTSIWGHSNLPHVVLCLCLWVSMSWLDACAPFNERVYSPWFWTSKSLST